VLIAISGVSRYGWSVALICCALACAIAAAWHLRTVPSGMSGKGLPAERVQMLAALPSFVRRRHFWPNMALCIGFPVTIGLIDKIEPFFFIDSAAAGGLGLDRELLGSFYTTAGFGGLILGSVLGSLAMARRSLPQLMLPVGLAMMTPAGIYLLLASLPSVSPALAAIGFLFARAFQAFGMIGYMVYLQRALSPGPFPVTHFNLATALKALTMMLTGMASGQVQHMLGYRGFFAFALACGLPLLMFCGRGWTSRATEEQWAMSD
jgi:MFS transporter, PAT family, beta-lactamase induction signal transducer AmpG